MPEDNGGPACHAFSIDPSSSFMLNQALPIPSRRGTAPHKKETASMSTAIGEPMSSKRATTEAYSDGRDRGTAPPPLSSLPPPSWGSYSEIDVTSPAASTLTRSTPTTSHIPTPSAPTSTTPGVIRTPDGAGVEAVNVRDLDEDGHPAALQVIDTPNDVAFVVFGYRKTLSGNVVPMTNQSEFDRLWNDTLHSMRLASQEHGPSSSTDTFEELIAGLKRHYYGLVGDPLNQVSNFVLETRAQVVDIVLGESPHRVRPRWREDFLLAHRDLPVATIGRILL